MSSQDILVVGEVQAGALAEISLELLGAARQLADQTGGQAVVLLMGEKLEAACDALGGADRVLLVEDPRLAAYNSELYVQLLDSVVAQEDPRAILIGSTSIGWDLAPLLAARRGVPMAVGCRRAWIKDGTVCATASICGGKLLADLALDKSPAVLMVLPGSFKPPEARGTPARVRLNLSVGDPQAVQFEKLVLPEAGDIDITTQEILVGVGRGIGQQENLEVVEQLAAALGGAVCASRPVVDQGWLPPTRQVGKSGMTVKPKLYLALGISGAPEHQEGMAGSELIIAVNTDPRAPIFEIAHFGAQIDLMDLVEPLTEVIRAKKAAG